jgi:hypothetical protein
VLQDDKMSAATAALAADQNLSRMKRSSRIDVDLKTRAV